MIDALLDRLYFVLNGSDASRQILKFSCLNSKIYILTCEWNLWAAVGPEDVTTESLMTSVEAAQAVAVD